MNNKLQPKGKFFERQISRFFSQRNPEEINFLFYFIYTFQLKKNITILPISNIKYCHGRPCDAKKKQNARVKVAKQPIIQNFPKERTLQK